MLWVRREQQCNKEKCLGCREGRSTQEGQQCHLLRVCVSRGSRGGGVSSEEGSPNVVLRGKCGLGLDV